MGQELNSALLWHEGSYLPPANDFATSWAHSMKRSTTGLKVRFFRVKITTSHGHDGISTGSIFKFGSIGAEAKQRPRDGREEPAARSGFGTQIQSHRSPGRLWDIPDPAP